MHTSTMTHKPFTVRTTASALSLALVCTALGSVPGRADTAEELSAAETAAAVTAADPTGLAVADINTTADGGATASANGSTVEIPADPADGVALTAGGESITINLPGSGQSEEATVVGDTVVFEEAAPSTDIAVQATTGGGVRQLITMAGPDAPRSYDFTVDVPEGATLELTDDGGARIARGDETITTISPAWARDANDAPVPTHYTVNGTTLTQHVAVDQDTAFPVTADPLWLAGWVLYIVGTRCGVGAAGAALLYRLSAQRRSMGGYFTNAAIGCVTGGLGIRRY